MNYGDYALKGTLESLAPLPPQTCPTAAPRPASR